MDYRAELVKAIKATHGASAALYLKTVPVKEVFRGETAWEGNVEVFAISGHKKAAYCYAWGYEVKPGDWEIVTVLELPPVDSPETAVKVAIAAHARGVAPQRQ